MQQGTSLAAVAFVALIFGAIGAAGAMYAVTHFNVPLLSTPRE